MTLRIEKTRGGPRVGFRLIGRIQRENLRDLEHRIAGEVRPVWLDLGEVTLVDVDVVRFLKDAEGTGTELRNCPSFIRAWVERERDVGGHMTTKAPGARIDMKLEVIVLGVSDVDRAKAFYEKLGWRLDADVATGGEFHVVQVTPQSSDASIVFGRGVTSPEPGSADGLVLVVNDIDAARHDLSARGVEVSDVFHCAGGPFNDTAENPRLRGRDPQDRSYHSFASFEDPDGNGWLLQEVRTRLPGREWPRAIDVPALAALLHEAAEHHGDYEKTHVEHHWWDWYAPYLRARQDGSSPEEAGIVAGRYVEEVLHVLPR